MKIVINKCYGGFGLSDLAKSEILTRKGISFEARANEYQDLEFFDLETGEATYEWDLDRDDSLLVEVVELLKEAADGDYAELKVIEIPDDVKWIIEEYDGAEWISEIHRTWE